MYECFEDDYQFQNKYLNIYLNGNNDLSYSIKLQKFNKLLKEIKKVFNYGENQELRLFNQQGVELFEDDIEFCKNDQVLYVSKGEEFDQQQELSEYLIIKKLGEGGFGKVFLAQHKKSNEYVALKIIKSDVIGNAQDIDMVFREAEMLKSLNHKYIVKILNFITLSDMQAVFVMEYYRGGELLQYVKNQTKLSETNAKFFFKQIAETVQYMHREKLIHRDLKLENILLQDENNLSIKIVDFGISAVSNVYLDGNDAGSLRYLAPEVILKKKNSLSPALVLFINKILNLKISLIFYNQIIINQDIWSLGVILYYMIYGQYPFNGKNSNETKDQILQQKLKFPNDVKVSDELIDVLNKMLNKECIRRITINELMEHPFITETYIKLPTIKNDFQKEEIQKPLQKKYSVQNFKSPELHYIQSTRKISDQDVEGKRFDKLLSKSPYKCSKTPQKYKNDIYKFDMKSTFDQRNDKFQKTFNIGICKK